MKKTYIPKIILQNSILYKGDPTYVGTSPVNLRMALIFTDLPTGSGSQPCPFQERTWDQKQVSRGTPSSGKDLGPEAGVPPLPP